MNKLFEDTFLAIVKDEEVFGKSTETVNEFSDISHNDLTEVLDIAESYSSAASKKLEEKYGFKVVKQFGGEGKGDDFYYVVQIKDKHFYIPGYYASEYGSELYWNDVYECEPHEVTVTQYRKVS